MISYLSGQRSVLKSHQELYNFLFELHDSHILSTQKTYRSVNHVTLMQNYVTVSSLENPTFAA